MIQTSAYLAAGSDQQGRMRDYRRKLAKHDIKVTSRWIDVKKTIPMQDAEIREDPVAASHYCEIDLADIDAADIFIMFTDTPSTSGGRHTELGYAIARDKVIFIVGPQENVFQAFHTVIHLTTVEELFAYLFGATKEH